MAYLSGRQSTSGQLYGTYSQDDVDALRALAEEPGIIDIFLTYPCYICKHMPSVNLSLWLCFCMFIIDAVLVISILCVLPFR